METYSVIIKSAFFKKTIKDIVGDGFISESGGRYFILKNGERIEVPTQKNTFYFSKERNEMLIRAEKQKAVVV